MPFNRNGVLFPRKVNGKYKLLNRPVISVILPLEIYLFLKVRISFTGEIINLLWARGDKAGSRELKQAVVRFLLRQQGDGCYFITEYRLPITVLCIALVQLYLILMSRV